MGSLLSLVTGWKGYAALALACLIAGSAGTWRVMSWREAAQETKQLKHTVELRDVRNQITFDVDMTFQPVQLKIQQETEKRLAEIPAHITPSVDRDFAIPCGFVRVYQSATHGPLPDPAGCPDGAPADVAFSTLGQTETINAGQYDELAAQLTALQDWVRQQQAVKP